MPLTIEWIRAAEDDKALFGLLSSELERLLPESIQKDRELYFRTLALLPRGLRAMAGIYFFDVSMSLDDLAWHFGNQNDERDLSETLNGLRELELFEIGDLFEQQWDFMKPFMNQLQTGDYSGKDFHDWLNDTGAQAFADPKNKIIWKYCEENREHGLLTSWIGYSRKYPERCVVSRAEA